MTIQLVIVGETVTVMFGERVATATWPDGTVKRIKRLKSDSKTNFVGRVVKYLTGSETRTT